MLKTLVEKGEILIIFILSKGLLPDCHKNAGLCHSSVIQVYVVF